MDYTLEFEKPVKELEDQIQELKNTSDRPGIDLSSEVNAMRKKVTALIQQIYSNLSPWERVQLSRHPHRPHASHYIHTIFDDLEELHGDRLHRDDPSVIAGLARLGEIPVGILGIEKGGKTQDKIRRNFGMPHPEGYRKGKRLMELLERFGLPLLCFVDTPGAYPGPTAEERGQSVAIAESLQAMLNLKVPTAAVIVGEGGSGGALGFAVCDHVAMLEYSVYSVISPESCASILWSDPKRAEQAANSLQLDPKTALRLKLIDAVISEPDGGAHRNPEKAMGLLKDHLIKVSKRWGKAETDPDELIRKRLEKYRIIGNQALRKSAKSAIQESS